MCDAASVAGRLQVGEGGDEERRGHLGGVGPRRTWHRPAPPAAEGAARLQPEPARRELSWAQLNWTEPSSFAAVVCSCVLLVNTCSPAIAPCCVVHCSVLYCIASFCLQLSHNSVSPYFSKLLRMLSSCFTSACACLYYSTSSYSAYWSRFSSVHAASVALLNLVFAYAEASYKHNINCQLFEHLPDLKFNSFISKLAHK